MTKYHIHLISDSTGQTLINITKAVLSQFGEVDMEEHIWSLTRTKSQMQKVIKGIEENPGLILYTVIDEELNFLLKEAAKKMKFQCIPALDFISSEFRKFLKVPVMPKRGGQHELDDEYFERVEAINYTLAHDDGQNMFDLTGADIILIGVSRTSKTPTSVYLANRGFKVANIPFVQGTKLPENIFDLRDILIVGLTINTDRLVSIRKNRMLSLTENSVSGYTDEDIVEDEVIEAKRLFQKNKWPIIDVTKRSVEETAATIIKFYEVKK